MHSIKTTKSFKTVYNNGQHFANHLFVMYSLANNGHESRLGISISKKVGNAVVRNRLRRQVKEVMRLCAHSVAVGFDIVIVVRVAAGALAQEGAYQKVDKALTYLLRKLGLFAKANVVENAIDNIKENIGAS